MPWLFLVISILVVTEDKIFSKLSVLGGQIQAQLADTVAKETFPIQTMEGCETEWFLPVETAQKVNNSRMQQIIIQRCDLKAGLWCMPVVTALGNGDRRVRCFKVSLAHIVRLCVSKTLQNQDKHDRKANRVPTWANARNYKNHTFKWEKREQEGKTHGLMC